LVVRFDVRNLNDEATRCLRPFNDVLSFFDSVHECDGWMDGWMDGWLDRIGI